MSKYTSPDKFEETYNILSETFKTGRTRNLAWRKWQLKQCWWMIEENIDAINAALKADLNRHEFESFAMEIRGMKADIMEYLLNFEKWAEGEVPDAGFFMGTLGKAKLRKEPRGVVLIIAAWNFPIYLLISPLVAAIATGNCILLKPSELAPATQDLVMELFPKYLDTRAIRLASGGPKETAIMLERRFDFILYTGGSSVARHIARAAAKHLTPVVLELGGQSPAIVCKTADINLAAKRIAYAKLLNCGQICLNVNHVFADPSIHDQLLERLIYWNEKFRESGDEQFSRIINEKHFDRVMGLLKKTRGVVVYGNDSNASEKWIKPTIVKDVTLDDSLLSEEIFGPIAPVMRADVSTAISTIKSMPQPLGLYIFSRDQSEIDYILDSTSSGGVTINDIMVHAGVLNAPFGGVGESGYGSYHGKFGFDAFSHTRTVVAPPTWMDSLMSFRYAPYDIKNKNNFDVKNRLGFKPGEVMEDQKIGKSTSLGSLATKFLAAVIILGVADSASGGRLLFVHTMKDIATKLGWK